MAPPAMPNLPPGYVFQPNSRQVIIHYLTPKALHGEVSGGIIPGCFVTEGVDVFSASPDALPFQPRHRRQDGEVWGYFFAVQPVGETRPAPGGCWARHGPEKGYEHGGEAVAFRRRFAFHSCCLGVGGVMWSPTRWLMKEYRLNKAAAVFRSAQAQPDPKANMDCVVLKVFTKPMVPSEDEEAVYSSEEDQARKRAGYSSEDRARKRARSR